MGEVTTTAITIFAVMMLFVSFMNVFEVLTVDEKLDQVDEFITKKVAVERAFTPQVEAELTGLMNQLGLEYGDFDFSGSAISPVAWGENIRVQYAYHKTFVQNGLSYLGISPVHLKPRDFQVVAVGR